MVESESTMNGCTCCGSGDPLVEGQWECVATAGDVEAVERWSVGLCRACALRAVHEERRKAILVAPLKGVLLTFFGAGSALGAYISLEEPGIWKLLAIPFAMLCIRGLVGGVPLLLGLPWVIWQIVRTRGHLKEGMVDERDRDLLLHLEAHRALDELKVGLGQLVLPEIPGQDPGSVRYTLQPM